MTHPHFRRISPAALADMWADRELTRAEIAQRVGLSDRGLTQRIKAIGLPLRGFANTKRPSIHPRDEPLFRALWVAGVGCEEIATHFGCDTRTVGHTCRRLSLPPRRPGTRPKATIEQFRQAQLGRVLALDAALEQAAIINAEMADVVGRSKLPVGAVGRAA